MDVAIKDFEGKPTTLQAGDNIIFCLEDRLLMLLRSPGDEKTSTTLRWSSGDDKKALDFINSEADFQIFAFTIAELLALRVRFYPVTIGLAAKFF